MSRVTRQRARDRVSAARTSMHTLQHRPEPELALIAEALENLCDAVADLADECESLEVAANDRAKP
jgi:hypothetical protein